MHKCFGGAGARSGLVWEDEDRVERDLHALATDLLTALDKR
jgi:hypothetical protein